MRSGQTRSMQRLVDPPLLGHELAADHPWTMCLHGAARAALGESGAPLSAAEWPCDAFLAQREFGIPTLLFGLRGAGSHAEVYLAAALEWCA
jgi:hypothetical protein